MKSDKTNPWVQRHMFSLRLTLNPMVFRVTLGDNMCLCAVAFGPLAMLCSSYFEFSQA